MSKFKTEIMKRNQGRLGIQNHWIKNVVSMR